MANEITYPHIAYPEITLVFAARNTRPGVESSTTYVERIDSTLQSAALTQAARHDDNGLESQDLTRLRLHRAAPSTLHEQLAQLRLVVPLPAGAAGASLAAQGAAASLVVHVAAFAAMTWTGGMSAPAHVAAHGGPSTVEAAWSPAAVGDLLGELPSEAPLPAEQPLELETPELEIAEVRPEHAEPLLVEPAEPPGARLPTLVDPLQTAIETTQPIDPVAASPLASSRGRAGNTSETAPRFDANAPIPYPPAALRDRLEGRVLLRLQIDAAGRVASVEVVESSGHAVLDRAAAEGVRSWQAAPARLLGRPVAAAALLPVRFRLDK